MYVPNYKMHHVLSDYTRKLGSARTTARTQVSSARTPSDKITLSPDARRQAIIEKVAERIVQRISRFGPQDDTELEIVERLTDEMENRTPGKGPRSGKFVYNVIDGENHKSTSSIPIQDPDFVLRRLTELAREMVDKNMVHPSG